MEKRISPDEVRQIATQFTEHMITQNEFQRSQLQVEWPSIATDEMENGMANEVDEKKQQIEKELGITKGTFKFKKNKKERKDEKKEDQNVIEMKPKQHNDHLLQKKKGVDEKALNEKLKEFEKTIIEMNEGKEGQ